ncbi:MAG: T9SS type B sorting domain-containing protein, partial [Flavobacteriaceae bacterium]|nr:T9SS type B sorting domain-containing protein [Flavobacteriaceae bacterium]
SYKWSNDAGVLSVDSEFTVTESGTYYLTVTDANECIGNNSINVTITDTAPKPEIKGDKVFCGESTTLEADNKNFKSYKWTDENNTVLSTTEELYVTMSGTYTLTVTDNNSCSGSVSVEVKKISLKDPTISGDLSFCEGGETKLTGSDGFDSYLWTSTAFSGTFSGQEITVTKEGTYYLTVTSEGCSKTTQVTVTVVPYPNIMQVLTSSVDGRAEVIVTPPGNYQYSLNMFTWQSSNIFTNLEIGEYKVWVKTDPGCIAGPFNFKFIEVPNVITPDGDSFNDSWRLRNLIGGTRVQVYNRYGKLLFDKTATGISEDIIWDGKYMGRVVPTTSYWYVITLPEGEKLTGWLVVRNYNHK